MQKYYAIKNGRKTGIFTQWSGSNGAETQVKSFPKALFKSFTSEADANKWLNEQSSNVTDNNTKKNIIEIFTDGACSGNPGPGGYAAIIRKQGKDIELYAGFKLTTNNRMELMACIAALEYLEDVSDVIVFSDSKYIVDAVEKGWAQKWKQNNWMRNKRDKAENSDLWGKLLSLIETHRVIFKWVRGHNGHPENERCDFLAVKSSQHPTLTDKYFENK